MAVQLDSTGSTVTLADGITLRTPGLVGQADARLVPTAAQRDESMAGAPDWVRGALEANEATVRYVVDVADTAAAPVEDALAVKTQLGEPAIVATVPAPPPDHVQVALVTDESGVMTWGLAEAAAPSDVRDGTDQTFVLRGTVPPAGRSAQRGAGGWLAKKVIRFVVIPVVKRAASEVGELLVRRWEDSNRPSRLRTFTPDNFGTKEAPDVPASVLRDWSGQPALLFVHGTSDRADSSFGGLGRPMVEDLSRRYGGRVFAFDHPTLATGPVANVRWFLEQLPPDVDLRLDVVCSSRGGLVSRILAERLDDPRLRPVLGGRRVTVDRLVFSATPNSGTKLVDTDHIGSYIDAVTNLLSLVPDNPVTDAADVIISLLGDLAAGVVEQLEGLQSMRPGGDLLTWLNSQPRAPRRYFALTSDFEPDHAGLKKWATDVLLDVVLGGPNDFVVPTAGVYGDVGGGSFPIADRYEFDRMAGVSHGGFFRHPVAQEHLRRWLEV